MYTLLLLMAAQCTSPATIIVKGPENMGVYFLNGEREYEKGPFAYHKVKSKGKIRYLQSPPLKYGKTYTYYIYTILEPINEESMMGYREVNIKAGGTYIIEFTEKDFK